MPLPLQHSLLRLEPPPPADAELCRSCVPSIMQGIWCLGQELASWLDRGPNPGNLVCAMNLSCNKHERVHAHTLPLTPPPCVDLSRPWLDWGHVRRVALGGVFPSPPWFSPQPAFCPVTLTWSELGQHHRGRTCLPAGVLSLRLD